jgi:hypothetical protein
MKPRMLHRDFPFEVSCYTFGSMRVGNAAFVEAFGSLVTTSWRIHTYYDVAPIYPPAGPILGYTHVGIPVCTRSGSDATECTVPSISRFRLLMWSGWLA